MRRLLTLSALALASLSFGLTVGDPAPPLKVEVLIKGTAVDLDKGVHVVEFWSTGFKPSTDAIGGLNDLAKKYKGKLDVTGVAVAERGDDPLGGVKRFVAGLDTKMDYNVAYDGEPKASTKAWLAEAQVAAIPAAFLVKDGKILWIGDPTKGLDKAVDQTLKGTFDLAAAKASYDAYLAARAAEIEKIKKAQAELADLLKPIADAFQAQDPGAALRAIDGIEAKRADLRPMLEQTRFEIYVGTADARLLELAKRFAAEDFKADADTLNHLAWTIVDPENEDPKPNYAVALVLAEKAAKVSEMKDANILDTYALALYRTGDKKLAFDLQKKAVAIAEAEKEFDPDSLKGIRERLEMFSKDHG